MTNAFPENLKLIQGVINRLASNSFLVKGWTITISVAGLGYYLNSRQNKVFLFVVSLSIIIFWFWDAYFLKQERLFRKLYEKNAKEKSENFSLNVDQHKNEVDRIFKLMFSFPNSVIYISLLLIITIIYFYG